MNKTVLITGASGGIGSAVALEFAKRNYHIALHYYTSEAEAIRLKEQLERNYQGKIFLFRADLSSEEQIKAMVTDVIQQFGKIDVLINNAGIAIDTLYQDKTAENFRKTLDVNLIGTFLLSRLVGDTMYQNRTGKIIIVSSTNGIDQGFPMSLDYDASKAALLSLTHNLAIQYAPYVNVNAVAPGWVKTKREMEGLDKEYIALEEQKILLHRFAEPEEIAKVIAFLASEDASYINSEVLRIDGGH